MKFINYIGYKKRINQFKKDEKELIIIGIKKKLKDGRLHLTIVGSNLKKNANYLWLISFGDESIIPSSKGIELVLNKANTDKYINSDITSVIITIEDYISSTFEL